MGLRGKEDPWNSIGSGAITGAVLAARGEACVLTLVYPHVAMEIYLTAVARYVLPQLATKI